MLDGTNRHSSEEERKVERKTGMLWTRYNLQERRTMATIVKMTGAAHHLNLSGLLIVAGRMSHASLFLIVKCPNI